MTIVQPRKISKVRPPLERAETIAVAEYLRFACNAGWLWSHFPAGELRNPKTAALLKRMGVQPGWPDFVFIGPDGRFHGLELKRVGGGRMSDDQMAFKARCEGSGAPYAVARGFEEAFATLQDWGVVGRAGK